VAGFIGTPAMNFIAGELHQERGGSAFRRGTWSVPLTGRLAADQLPQQTRAVELGVRAEHIKLSTDSNTEGSPSIPAVVSLVEMLGDATIVTARLEADGNEHKNTNEEPSVIIKMDPRSDLEVGQSVRLSIDPGKLHVFDPATGDNWVRPPAESASVATKS